MGFQCPRLSIETSPRGKNQLEIPFRKTDCVSDALPRSFWLTVWMCTKPSVWMCDRKTLMIPTEALKPNVMPGGSHNARKFTNNLFGGIRNRYTKAEIDGRASC